MDLLCALATFGLSLLPHTSAAAPAAATRLSPPTPAEMTNAELIALLPPAGEVVIADAESWKIYGEWQRRVDKGRVSDDEMAAAISRSGVLRASPQCAEGEPFHVCLRRPGWLRGEVTAVPLLQYGPDIKSCDVGTAALRKARTTTQLPYCDPTPGLKARAADAFQEIGILQPGTTQLTFLVSVKPVTRPPMGYPDDYGWTGLVTLPIEIIPSAASAAPPKATDSAEIRAAIRDAVQLRCTNDYGPWDLRAKTWRPIGGPLASTYFPLRIDLLRNGDVVTTLMLADPDEEIRITTLTTFTWVAAPIGDTAATDILRHTNLDRYTIRIRGVEPTRGGGENGACRWLRTRYWNGEVLLPLAGPGGILDP